MSESEIIMGFLKAFFPLTVFFWCLTFFCTIRKPYKFINAFYLLIALFLTLLLLGGLFDSNIGYALITEFLVILLALLLVLFMLVFNGVLMIKRESASFVHLLSLFLGIITGLGEMGIIRLKEDIALLHTT